MGMAGFNMAGSHLISHSTIWNKTIQEGINPMPSTPKNKCIACKIDRQLQEVTRHPSGHSTFILTHLIEQTLAKKVSTLNCQFHGPVEFLGWQNNVRDQLIRLLEKGH